VHDADQQAGRQVPAAGVAEVDQATGGALEPARAREGAEHIGGLGNEAADVGGLQQRSRQPGGGAGLQGLDGAPQVAGGRRSQRPQGRERTRQQVVTGRRQARPSPDQDRDRAARVPPPQVVGQPLDRVDGQQGVDPAPGSHQAREAGHGSLIDARQADARIEPSADGYKPAAVLVDGATPDCETGSRDRRPPVARHHHGARQPHATGAHDRKDPPPDVQVGGRGPGSEDQRRARRAGEQLADEHTGGGRGRSRRRGLRHPPAPTVAADGVTRVPDRPWSTNVATSAIARSMVASG
jgi:hypothetical protein